MLHGNATPPTQRRPYLRRGGVWQDVGQTENDETFTFVTFLSQGAAVGAFFGFLHPAYAMLSHPENGYNALALVFLPAFIANGVVFGLVESAVIWGCAHNVGHPLKASERAGIGIVVLALLLFLSSLIFAQPSRYREEFTTSHYLYLFASTIVFGSLFGLVIGSTFRPWPQLIRGTTSDQNGSVSAISLVLRVVVIFGLMESVLYLILTQQRHYADNFMVAAIAFTHFIAVTLVVFSRTTFSALVKQALIINFPIVLFILGISNGNGTIRLFALIYLGLWAAFLVCRVSKSDEELDE